MKRSMLSRIFAGKHSKKDKQVTLVVKDGGEGEETRIRLSKSALGEHSAVFRELKKGSKIVLENVTSVALHKIVEFVQKSSATFLSHSEALETLSAATAYGIDSLSKICVNNLVTVLDAENVCDVYEATTLSHQNNNSILEYHCLKVIDKEAEVVLRSRGFTSLRKATALAIVKRTSLRVSSEMTVFQAVLGWGLNACLRQGGDPDDPERFLPLVKYLLNYVRFQAMTDEEMRDPEVSKYHTLITASVDHGPFQACNPGNLVFKDRSSSTTSSTSLVPDPHPRRFLTAYTHPLDLLESSHQLKTGDTFALTLEVLKGKIFLTGVRLVLKPFAKRAACLYVAVTAANATTRGTFSSSDEENACLRFTEPVTAGENERVSVSVSVKRAENVRLWIVKEDVQIAMPESKAVAFKVTPAEGDGRERCILKEIEYFF